MIKIEIDGVLCMIERHNTTDNLLFKEMSLEEQEEYFSFYKNAFVHNIDTFYYSVKFKNDFRLKTHDDNVINLRKYFRLKYDYMADGDFDAVDFHLKGMDRNLVLRPVTFSRFYSTCLSYPEYFDIFLAPVVPKAADGGESVTSECIVQIRSYMLWQYGVRDSFENSYRYVKAVAEHFGLQIDHVQENRIDYCWHTNYLSNPEKFFAPDSFYKMRVDRFKNATYVTNKVGSEDYEIDYVALGKRSDKVFVRIYLKTREVIEQNYKPWFFQVWHMYGMINRYDLYVYEKCYERRSWFYRFYARLEFYREHGTDPEKLARVAGILDGKEIITEDALIRLADELTPRINLVVNVEYQTMRRHSKSYELIPFRDYSGYGEAARLYQYFDNRKLISDYLTDKVFRMVEKTGAEIKSHRPLCGFWKALRSTRCIDMRMTPEQAKLVRNYNRKLNIDAMKKRVLCSAVTLGVYTRGLNEDSPMQDAFEALMRFNDNDIYNAVRYKTRKLRQFNPEELAGVYEGDTVHGFMLLDEETGEVFDYDSLKTLTNGELENEYKNNL